MNKDIPFTFETIISQIAQCFLQKIVDNAMAKHMFTVRNSSCGNVMFLHVSVILFTGEGGASGQTSRCADHPPHRVDTPPGQTPPPRDGHCSE